MAKRVRTPDIARRLFTPNQLFGWPEYCQYQPAERRRKKHRDHTITPTPFVPVRVVTGGVEI